MFNLINLFNIVRLKFNLYKLKFLNLLIKKPQISGYKIIFKMDDLNSYSNAIIKLDKIIDKENIKVSWGIIGNSLEMPSKEFLKFIIDRKNDKRYHFFNHGYYHYVQTEFEFKDTSCDRQKEIIMMTQNIVNEKTGIILDTFGAPCNKIDFNTTNALNEQNDIKYWYYGNEEYKGINFIRQINIEKTAGCVDFLSFKKQWEACDNKVDVIVLQAHPNLWNKTDFVQFELIIQFLKYNNCKFISPNEINK